ncbi:MAG: class I SAM-dependent methyltransferase [Candidatus Coatesbacteria bacterium]|nr:class I SAM-dependent methyltransferase [Candidatus Coatesbacteria bacterium]
MPAKNFHSKPDLLEAALAPYDLAGKRVLDAGTGHMSARALLRKKPASATLVAAPGDERKAKPAREVLAEFRAAEAKVVLGDLTDIELFQRGSFDFILADYLIGEIDCFSPSAQFPILRNLYAWLSPGAGLLIIDIEPTPGRAPGGAATLADLQYWGQAANLLSRQWRTLPRDYEGSLVASWLEAIGFQTVRIDHCERILEPKDAKELHERALRCISELANENLRVGLKHEVDETLARIDREQKSGLLDLTQINYIIRAAKTA